MSREAELYLSGMSLQDVADMLGITSRTVRTRLEKQGIKIRNSRHSRMRKILDRYDP